jgi:heat shock protein HspQ
MKPTVNYGLSDSLIDAVRKSVEEAKLHPNQQKLDVHEPEKDELTSKDFEKLRAGKKVKNTIDTKPKLKEEDELDEGHFKIGDKVKFKTSGMKGEVVKLDKEDGADDEKYYTIKGEDGKMRKMAPQDMMKEEEQIDELSNKTYFAAYKAADRKTGSAAIDRDGGIKNKNLKTKELAYKGVKRNNAKQMDEANSDNPAYEKDLIKIDMHHYKEADHHRKTLRTLGAQGKLNTPEGKFHKAALEKHQAALNAMAADDHNKILKKSKQSMRSNLKREEVEQMDEVKLADLPRRKVMGKSYGADYVDPEGADDADMKKPEPKRKSGPQGTMKRRFSTKSYEKIKGKLKAQY